VFLILHGYMGSGPDHWQTWLAARLRAKGERVASPGLPNPEHPRRAAWRAAFADAIEDGATVIAHSLACVVWLDHCADPVCPARPERVLLVAPPSRAGAPEELAEFFPVPLDAGRVAAAAGSTRLACAPDDPYCPEDAALLYGAPLGLDVDLLPGAAHVNPESGYGPWPGVEAWCYGASASTSSRIAPG
jgi:predicted alpha/beta hydrolase family esterase